LDQRILTAEYLETKWLAKQERGADAEVSQAAQSNSKRRDDAYDSRKLDGVAEEWPWNATAELLSTCPITDILYTRSGP
jgi:hypothetical protein